MALYIAVRPLAPGFRLALNAITAPGLLLGVHSPLDLAAPLVVRLRMRCTHSRNQRSDLFFLCKFDQLPRTNPKEFTQDF
jgi:hypothetical protein